MKYPPGCKEIHVELSDNELIRRLKNIQQVYQDLKPEATEKYKELSVYLGSDVLVENRNEDVQLLVACCVSDVYRIFKPECPYQSPSNLKKIFTLLVNQLKGLKSSTNTSFKRYYYLLERLESENIFSACLELEDAHDIVVKLFETIFKTINEKTDVKVKTLMSSLLIPLLNEPDQISPQTLDILFTMIIEPQKSINREAFNLASDLIKKANQHFEFFVQNYLNNVLLSSRCNVTQAAITSTVSADSLNTTSDGDNDDEDDEDFRLVKRAQAHTQNTTTTGASSNQFISDKLCLIIYELSKIRYALLDLVMPQLEYKLKSNELKERREYTKLLSKMFSERESKLAQQLPQLWEAYLERFADANEDVRKICIQHIGDFLIQQSALIKSASASSSSTSINSTSLSTTNALGSNVANQAMSTIIFEHLMEQIRNRSLDSEESLRLEVVQEILKAMRQDSNLINAELLTILKDRTLDVKIKVRKVTLQGLSDLYKKAHSKASQSRKTVQLVEWIPSKIMRIYFQESSEDKLLVERLLNNSIVPYSLDTREKMAHLYYAFSTLDEYALLSLIDIMKNRMLINQHMKSIIEQIEMAAKKGTAEASQNSKLEREIMIFSCFLFETSKVGVDFMKTFVNLLKTNHNLRTYFKNFVNPNCSCSKSMQLIQLMFTNLSELNQTQTALAKRLIERMSSLIIDKECFECLIELVECKLRQRITAKQRKLLSRQKKSNTESQANTKGRRKTAKSSQKADKKANVEDDDEYDSDKNDDDDEDDYSEDDQESVQSDSNEMSAEEEDDKASKTSQDSSSHGDVAAKNRLLVKNIDDDGEKGLKLINMIFTIHNASFLATYSSRTAYEKMFSFISSPKEHISSASLKLLGNYFPYQSVKDTYGEDDLEAFNAVNNTYTSKLLNFAKSGKPKQAKYAIQLIYNNFEQPKNEQLLYDLYKELTEDLESASKKKIITSLVSLGHICLLMPKRVGKEIKDFLSKSIVKEILMQPLGQQLEISSSNESSLTNSLLAKSKKTSALLAESKWCDNQEQLPFNTLVRIHAVKLMSRWCIGLKSESSNILFTLKIIMRLIKESSTDTSSKSDEKPQIYVSEAERSRLRSVCGSQLLKIAQEPCFRSLITAEYFHALAKQIIDPVTNVRDIIIKKLHKGLKSNRLPVSYMSMFALVGLDSNRERKMRVKKMYAQLIKTYRKNEAAESAQKPKVLLEMCISYAVSLIAHNVKIESIKDDHKMKQIKECMSIILDPLLESPDGNQIALIKKILNKIKLHDDGLASTLVTNTSKNQQTNKVAIQNLYIYNKSLCFVCEIFLFHMHSKMSSVLKEYPFDVKLPAGFYTAKETSNNEETENEKLSKEVEQHLATQRDKKPTNDGQQSAIDAETGIDLVKDAAMVDNLSEKSVSLNSESSSAGTNETPDGSYEKRSLSVRGSSRIEIKSKKRKANETIENAKSNSQEAVKSVDENRLNSTESASTMVAPSAAATEVTNTKTFKENDKENKRTRRR